MLCFVLNLAGTLDKGCVVPMKPQLIHILPVTSFHPTVQSHGFNLISVSNIMSMFPSGMAVINEFGAVLEPGNFEVSCLYLPKMNEKPFQ